MNQQNLDSQLGVVPPLMGPITPSMMAPVEFTQAIEQFEVPKQLAQAAIDTRSDLFGYGMFKVMSTLGTIMFMKQAYTSMGVIQEYEPWLYQYAQQYLMDMNQISAVAMERILYELQTHDGPQDDVSGISRVLRRITRYLEG